MSFDPSRQASLLILFALLPSLASAQAVAPLGRLLQQSEQQQQFIRGQVNAPTPATQIDVVRQQPDAVTADTATCFPIETVMIEERGDGGAVFRRDAAAVLARHGFHADGATRYRYDGSQAPCLNSAAIEQMVAALQNAIIDRGYVTTRVLIAQQNLADGVLTLTLIPGRIAAIDYAPQSDGKILTLTAAFPTQRGEVANLRDLEQGLDNLRRLSSVQASIDIAPSTEAGFSDIVVRRTQVKPPFFFSATLDDSGSKPVGRYLGTLGLGWENPLSLNDTLQVSYAHTLRPGVTLSDASGKQHSGSDHYSVQYALPIGYWHFAFNASKYNYDQVVAGQTRNYRYSGASRQGEATLTYTLYRSQRLKSEVQYGLWQRSSHNYVNDAEVDVQRRRSGGWKAHLKQHLYFDHGSLDLDLGYQRGTGAFGSIPAPEAYWGEGSERMKIWTADLDWQQSFTLGAQQWHWRSRFHGQWPQTRLTALDKISIGGRNSVRGYTGDVTLTAERGWYWRHDLSWYYRPQQRIYLGFDAGHVSGPSAQYLPGRTLTGSALGVSGSVDARGQWFYDAFIGIPLKHPAGFPAKGAVAGFTVSYRWPQ